MRLTLLHARRRPLWPWWAVSLVVGWVALGCATIYVGQQQGRPVTLCLLKRVTGLPCPTCGVTRAAEHLIRGRIGRAIAAQPFMFCAGAVFVCLTILRVGFARRLQVEISQPVRTAGWGLVAAAFVVNWVYVILFVG